MQILSLSIAGMSCGHCVAAVRDALAAVPGVQVQDVRVGGARVAAAEGVPAADVLAAVEAAGYDATFGEPAGDASAGATLTPLRGRGER
ncbi:MAG: heavy-metal-associated domain-containing protein [Gemmatirosa sp.]